ncbi:hypothetical protein HN371_11885 [Candidatus Poribacteria bacterium]|jgi:Arc/MetJ-type ribon-helix-helix transcriptional regulator|nr:hypothetical protein [Candidatus Poribacteria bacterium]MBT5532412.1 hypothetical protein [Candidatus Poribacteria bacterium]MBT5710590.1 hypothetical protein [Candidatus Poribacteria bacterium]MBT7096419.1 hypothetical protein [Candidatus Poribacteria bacterium]MBT7807675.1 hypothetical protein [Candidatus Poribacteria bacterium]
MDITLAPEQEKLVKQLMESGAYKNEDAAVAEALRVFEEEFDVELMMPKSAARAEIQKSLD